MRFAFATCGDFQTLVAGVCSTLGGAATVKYVFTDHQGSTRAVLDGNGAVLARHDYLPFGEELWATTGMRTAGQKFGAMDQSRMRYGLTEKDEATGLDHTWWRKHDNIAGRWTSPDPLGGSVGDPQSFNRYAYVQSDPVNFVDPSGLIGLPTCGYYNEIGVFVPTPCSITCRPGEACDGGSNDDGFGGPQNPLSGKEATDAIVKQVNALLKDKQCKSFLDSMLSALGTATGVAPIKSKFSDVFKDLSKRVGFYDGTGVLDDYGLTELNNGHLSIGVDFSRATPTGVHSIGITAIHETFHAAASADLYSQYDTAAAAYAVGRQMGLIPELVGPPKEGKSMAADAYNSTLITNAIFAACGKQ